MYTITTLESPPVVIASVGASLSDAELRQLLRDLDERLLDPGSSEPPCLLFEQRDAAAALAPHQAKQVDAFLSRTVDSGLRVGRVVATALLARQLDRIASEAAMGEHLRHFDARAEALAWLRQPPA